MQLPQRLPCLDLPSGSSTRPSQTRVSSRGFQPQKRRRLFQGASSVPEVLLQEPLEEAHSSGPHLAQSLTEQIFASSSIEGDPRRALKMCEAYWSVSHKCSSPPWWALQHHGALGKLYGISLLLQSACQHLVQCQNVMHSPTNSQLDISQKTNMGLLFP